MKKLAVFLVCLLMLGCGGSQIQRGNGIATRRVVQHGLEATVGFYSAEEENIYCTGFFIEKDLIVTAKHCVVDSDTFPVLIAADKLEEDLDLVDLAYGGKTFDGINYESWSRNRDLEDPKTFKMKVVYLNAHSIEPGHNANDIAILTVVNSKDYNRRPFKIARRTPFVGEKVYSFGMPLSIDFVTFEGNIARLETKADNKTVGSYLVNILIAPGSSGGPLMDHNGHVVGVNSAGLFLNVGPEAHIAFAIGRDSIEAHVKMAKKKMRAERRKFRQDLRKEQLKAGKRITLF